MYFKVNLSCSRCNHKGGTLSYFKAPHSPNPLGSISLAEISLENLSIAKNSEFCFKLVTSRRTYYLKANSQKEYEEWLVLIEAAKESVAPINPRASVYIFADGTLSQILTRVIVRHLTETIDQEIPGSEEFVLIYLCSPY